MNGKAHRKATIYVAAPLSAFLGLGIGAVAGQPLVGTLSACGGALAGIIVNPDLDQPIIDSIEYKLMSYTEGLWGFWLIIWFPYAKHIRHRSPLSHMPIISTAGRVGWLAWHPVILLVLMALGKWLPITFEDMLFWPVAAFGLGPFLLGFMGLCVADFFHWILDGRPVRAIRHDDWR